MEFNLTSDYIPTGDQPTAIKQLEEGLVNGDKFQTLLGVTGSGKTFTIANVIEKVQKPTLIISHNKTLAAQLYNEFKTFFPDNKVEYFVSYYDYYQPEAYLPTTDTYIEKDLSINDEIEKLRLSTTSALLSGRNDVIVVSSVSCLYGIGNPDDFHENIIHIKVNQKISRAAFLHKLVTSLYYRTEIELKRGTFRVKGDTIDVYVAYSDIGYRFIFWGDVVEEIYSIDPIEGDKIEDFDYVQIFPANIFVTTQERIHKAIHDIRTDLGIQIQYFNEIGKPIEAKRVEERVNYDLEMILELGYCSGIENYSRYFDGRKAGSRPFCLIDYFPKDFLTIIDESHVTVPQIRAMQGGDRSRKENLVEYGFRLPSAKDNRPLKFEEFEQLINQVIFVSATPADFELQKCGGVIAEQVVRPTGLLDPPIYVRPISTQIDDLITEIHNCTEKHERVLVTTLTKRMAEELAKYFTKLEIRCRYIHSEVHTLDRIEILEGLRKGTFDVLIGVNLLREGLDLPEVSLVAILDADKEGFLRSHNSLTQVSGRAARNVNGKVIMYADKITRSMKLTIDNCENRRDKQIKYNIENNITPQTIIKGISTMLSNLKTQSGGKMPYIEPDRNDLVADPIAQYLPKDKLIKLIDKTRNQMIKAAKELNFIEAARFRDEVYALEKVLNGKK